MSPSGQEVAHVFDGQLSKFDEQLRSWPGDYSSCDRSRNLPSDLLREQAVDTLQRLC